MTSPKQLKYWRKNVKIIYWNYLDFICYFYCIKNIACFQNIYFVLKKCSPYSRFSNKTGKFYFIVF